VYANKTLKAAKVEPKSRNLRTMMEGVYIEANAEVAKLGRQGAVVVDRREDPGK
jgi:acyl-coenzyme A thioesterase PaaI-like protein